MGPDSPWRFLFGERLGGSRRAGFGFSCRLPVEPRSMCDAATAAVVVVTRPFAELPHLVQAHARDALRLTELINRVGRLEGHEIRIAHFIRSVSLADMRTKISDAEMGARIMGRNQKN
jgi:hypothetical protein